MTDTNSNTNAALRQAPQKTQAPPKESAHQAASKSSEAKKENNFGLRGYGIYDRSDVKLASGAGWMSGHVPQPYPNLYRNDPCGCGSGKKYKKCCLNK